MNRIIKLILSSIALLFSFATIGQNVTVYEHFEDFEPLLHQENDTTYVINFWATWCQPCVKELPEFEEINHKFKDQKFKMILVSLDFDTQLESKVKPFIINKKLTAGVVLLADSKQNKWISEVNESWTGSIPATLIYNRQFEVFTEATMSFEELNTIITKNIIK